MSEIDDFIDDIEQRIMRRYEWIDIREAPKGKKISAVYILFSFDGILYVGQSGHVRNRIKQHRNKKAIPFLYAIYLEIPEQQRTYLETELIWHYKPKFNKLYPEKK